MASWQHQAIKLALQEGGRAQQQQQLLMSHPGAAQLLLLQQQQQQQGAQGAGSSTSIPYLSLHPAGDPVNSLLPMVPRNLLPVVPHNLLPVAPQSLLPVAPQAAPAGMNFADILNSLFLLQQPKAALDAHRQQLAQLEQQAQVQLRAQLQAHQLHEQLQALVHAQAQEQAQHAHLHAQAQLDELAEMQATSTQVPPGRAGGSSSVDLDVARAGGSSTPVRLVSAGVNLSSGSHGGPAGQAGGTPADSAARLEQRRVKPPPPGSGQSNGSS